MHSRTTVIWTRPAVCTHGAWETHASKKGTPSTARAPCPSSTTLKRQMIHSNADPRKENANEGTGDDIPAVVSIVKPSRRRNEKSHASGHEDENHRQYGRRGTTITDRGSIIAVVVTFDGELGKIRENDRALCREPEGQVAQSSKGDL